MRKMLLKRLERFEDGRSVKAAVLAVGDGSRPIGFTQPQKQDLFLIIEEWAAEVRGGFGELPEEIFSLRNALADDLHDAQQ